jgi:hypothetical protein
MIFYSLGDRALPKATLPTAQPVRIITIDEKSH